MAKKRISRPTSDKPEDKKVLDTTTLLNENAHRDYVAGMLPIPYMGAKQGEPLVAMPLAPGVQPEESRIVTVSITPDKIEIEYPSVPGRVMSGRPQSSAQAAGLRRAFERNATTHSDGTRSLSMACVLRDGQDERQVAGAAIAMLLSDGFAQLRGNWEE